MVMFFFPGDPRILFFSALFFLIAAVFVSYIDIKEMKIPFWFWLAPLIAALFEALCQGIDVFVLRTAEAILVFIALLLFRKVMQGKFGLGDVKFISATTVSLGIQGVLIELLVAALSGIAFCLFQRKYSSRIPFAPFIALGICASFLALFTYT